VTEEDEKKAIAQQQRDIEALRAKLERLCDGYTLAQVCKGLSPQEYQEEANTVGQWDGLGAPKGWYLKKHKLDAEAYWKLSPAERNKRLEVFYKVKA
jgi:hypothetical protein